MSRLKNLTHYLEKLIQHSSDIFWIRNSDYSKQLYVSPAYEQIFGFSSQHLYQFPESWIHSIFPEDRERLKKDLAKRNPSALPGQKFYQLYRIARSDGKMCWIEDESFAIFDSKGNHIGFAGIARDITPVPIIGLTAHVQKQDMEKGVHMGMNKIFSKPLSLSLAQDILKQVMTGAF